MESSLDAIVAKDLNGIVTDWNAAAEAMLGYKAEEIIGRPITTIIPPERHDEEATILDRVRRGERLVVFETIRRHKNGRIVPVALTISPIRDDAGRIIGVSKIGRDLTEHREQQRQLAELQAELIHVSRINDMAHMVSALAHEINQPLTAITNYANGLRRMLSAGRTQGVEQALERVAEQATRAREIIQRLRNLMQKGKTEQRPEDMRETIEEAAALSRAAAPASEPPALQVQVDDDAATGVIDRIQIQQVLLNLMRNAAEAMQDVSAPRLSVRAQRDGDMIRVSVVDTGPGLPEDVRARLFQPFVTTKATGMGVGLSVCRTIIEAHGGEIGAEDASGGGTVFRFTVPAADASQHPRC
ncbi:MAG: PAS domain S-box protein [Proteobacteria bacterium]|nr:PAS domain S-box protein [Pseudomonadota bacterium]